MRRIRQMSPKLWLACGFVGWLAALATAAASPPGPADGLPPAEKSARPQDSAQPPPAPAGYVGADTCLGCHDDKRQGYEGSAHHRAADPRSPAARNGCETCHGPGGRHVEDPETVKPNRFSKMAPEAVNEVCTTCHNRGDHALWEGSQHESRGVACTSCHSVHAYSSEQRQLKDQLALCGSCHRDKVSKLDRSGHMPVREGKMQCTSCHNVHGSTNTRLLRKGDSIAESCASCHADKRGPFLWEHAPGRDGCTTCHDPHGSSNERMLVAKPPIMCQRCHVATRHPSTIYDAALVQTSARVYSRSCVTCHASIHGSNHPSGRFFVR